MKVAALIASRNRPDLVENMIENLTKCSHLPLDFYVVECGTDPDQLSPHSNLWYADPDFRGKCYGHNIALNTARITQKYDYYWILMNDVIFDPAQNPLKTLVETMQANPRMGILSPTEPGQKYPGGDPRRGGGWRKITTCDYLGFLMRGSALEEVGFLNPDFKYCWGAIHELSYKLYSSGWFLAFSDDVSYRHLGGSTYGQKNTRTISREEYQLRARRFALTHMVKTYGWNWADRFLEATHGHEIEVDTFKLHRQMWATGFQQAELQELENWPLANHPSDKPPVIIQQIKAAGRPVRLHLGAGPDRKDGWINVDINRDRKPDILSQAHQLAMIPDGVVDEIEANHLFEHFHYGQAHAALAEWRRILRPGGRIALEMPNLHACLSILGKHPDQVGIDLGLSGIYGWPPAIEDEGAPQMHKWGWTPESIQMALERAGFTQVQQVPVTQLWREATKFGRDMRVQAVAPWL